MNIERPEKSLLCETKRQIMQAFRPLRVKSLLLHFLDMNLVSVGLGLLFCKMGIKIISPGNMMTKWLRFLVQKKMLAFLKFTFPWQVPFTVLWALFWSFEIPLYVKINSKCGLCFSGCYHFPGSHTWYLCSRHHNISLSVLRLDQHWQGHDYLKLENSDAAQLLAANIIITRCIYLVNW